MLFYLISNIFGIYGLYQIPFTPESSRVITGLFTGCVIELIAVALGMFIYVIYRNYEGQKVLQHNYHN